MTPETLALVLPCGHCGARTGEPCRTVSGRLREPHARRIRLAQLAAGIFPLAMLTHILRSPGGVDRIAQLIREAPEL